MARNHDMSDGHTSVHDLTSLTVGSMGDHSLETSLGLTEDPQQGCVALAMSPGSLEMSHCVE